MKKKISMLLTLSLALSCIGMAITAEASTGEKVYKTYPVTQELSELIEVK
ncbi:hypothetical protein [Clostridium sp.]